MPSDKAKKDATPSTERRPLRKLEAEMLRRGYASAKMVAQKVCVHFATILNYAKEKKLVSIQHGSQTFIEIESVKALYGDLARTTSDWDDWTFSDGVDKRS
jgi:hypothetical protein